MGRAVYGKEKKVWIDDGTGSMAEVPYQGDATFSTGKTAEISRTKNGSHPYATDSGASISFSIEPERPALAVHTRLRTLALAEDTVDFWYMDGNTGGERVVGSGLVVLGDETTNVEGVQVQQVTLSFVDDPTYETVT